MFVVYWKMIYFAKNWQCYVLWRPASSELDKIICTAKCKTALGIILKREIPKQNTVSVIL